MINPPPRTSRTHAWSRWVWLGYWAFAFAITHTPMPGGAHLPVRFADKIVHFGLYCLLVLLGGRALAAGTKRVAISTILIWSLVYAAYGVFDEWLQQFVGRTMSAGDWMADAAGILAGTIVLIFVHRTPREKP